MTNVPSNEAEESAQSPPEPSTSKPIGDAIPTPIEPGLSEPLPEKDHTPSEEDAAAGRKQTGGDRSESDHGDDKPGAV